MSRVPNFISAFAIFAYQTSDAVDGKHARNTNQSTPLGALMDHLVDALVGCILAITVCFVNDNSLGHFSCFWSYHGFATMWFLAQWSYFETGVLATAGITEAELAVVILLVLPGFLGVEYQDGRSPLHVGIF